MICFIRVDDRLIHGQVQTSWISLSRAKNILVIDDEVSNDDVAKQILKFATPNGMKLKVLSIADGYDFWEKAQLSNNNIMVMVGPSSYKDGSKEIIQSTYFSEQEMEDTKKLDELGVNIYFQHTPEQKKIYYRDIKK